MAATDEHSSQTSEQYMDRLRHSQWALVVAVCLATAAVQGCRDDADDDRRNNAESRLPPAPDLDAELATFDARRVRTAMARLARAVDQPGQSKDARLAYEHVIAKRLIDVWLYAKLATRMVDSSETNEEREPWLAEMETWNEILELGLVRTEGTRGERLAQRLRPILRQMLRTQTETQWAERALTFVGAAEAGPPGAWLRASRRLAELDSGPLALQAQLLLAADADRALLDTQTQPLASRPLTLALATGRFCPDGVGELAVSTSAQEALWLGRHRCGFACTPPPPLGLKTPTALPELSADTHESCRLGHLGDAPGYHLSLDNALALESLAEVQRIRDALATLGASDDELARVAQPFTESFAARVETLIVPGALPFFARSGPLEIDLPGQVRAITPLEPSPVVATVRDGALWLSAWPRYHIGDAAIRAVGDEWAFPGKRVAELTTGDASELRAHLDVLLALPWFAADPTAETLTVVIDGSQPTRDLQLAVAHLAATGVHVLNLATWSVGDSLLPRPVTTGVSLRIDPPPQRTPAVRLADNATRFVDPQGRPTPIAVFEVDDFLPDVYRRVARYRSANPAIAELILEIDPDLTVNTLVRAVEALSYRREGDVMASTDALLAAKPLESRRQPAVRLLDQLYFRPSETR